MSAPLEVEAVGGGWRVRDQGGLVVVSGEQLAQGASHLVYEGDVIYHSRGDDALVVGRWGVARERSLGEAADNAARGGAGQAVAHMRAQVMALEMRVFAARARAARWADYGFDSGYFRREHARLSGRLECERAELSRVEAMIEAQRC